MTNRILPRHGLWIQIIVHVKYRTLNISDAAQFVLGYIRVEHRLRSGENDRIRARVAADFLLDQALQKVGFAMLLSQLPYVDGSKLHGLDRFPESGKVNLLSRFLPVDHPAFA